MSQIDELRKYLVKCPKTFGYRFRTDARRDLRRALFQAASINGKYINWFFKDIDPELVNEPCVKNLDENDMDVDDESSVEGNEMKWILNNEDDEDPKHVDPSHPGRPCMRKFKRGEPTYRCLYVNGQKKNANLRFRTCGLDETCVMCRFCFDPEEHPGHQITYSISQQDSGGACDCGDPEAWVNDFKCKHHQLENFSNDPLPDDLVQALEETIQVAVDYTIDVFSQSHTVIQRFHTEDEILANRERARLSKDVYGIKDDDDNDKFVLTLWNDQKHSFHDAINTIMRGTRKNRGFAEMVTNQIDANGRGMVLVTSDLGDLINKKTSMERTGLVHTIRSQKDTFREESCATVFEWLNDISKIAVNNNYLAVRNIICDVFCSQWNYGLAALRSDEFEAPASNEEFEHGRETDRQGALDGPYIPDPMKFVEERKARAHDRDRDNNDEDFIEDDDEDDELQEGEVLLDQGAAAAVAAVAGAGTGGAGVPLQREDDDNDENDQEVVGEEGGEEGEGEGEGEGANQDDDDDEEGPAPAVNRNALFALMNPQNGMNEIMNMLGHQLPHRLPDVHRIKRQKLTQNKSAPNFWTNEWEKYQAKRQKVSPRIQYLIFFDIRLWKSLRMLLRDMYVAIIISNANYKLSLGQIYADVYPQVVELHILADREPECSIITSLSTQLFTTPSIATTLCQRDCFTRIIAGMYTFVTTQHIAPPPAVNPEASLPQDTRILRNRRFNQVFHDLEFILNRNNDKSTVNGVPDRVAQVADFIMLFQGQTPMTRRKDAHIEFESESWLSVFNIMPYVQNLGVNVALGLDKARAHDGLQVIMPLLFNWVSKNYGKMDSRDEVREPPKFRTVLLGVENMAAVREMETIRASVLQFEVHNALVSLHHPAHSYVSHFIENGAFDTAEELREALLPSNRYDQSLYTNEQVLQAVLDHPLRTMVLLAQIQAYIWVRNGSSLRSQMEHYRELMLREVAYRRDLVLAQTLAVVIDPSTALLTFQDRWDMNFQSLKSGDELDDTIDMQKRLTMVQYFLHFLLGVLMVRHPLMRLDEKENKRQYTRREIVQSLCFRELTYSDLCRSIPDHLTTDAVFEEILNQMTIFKPPRGVADSGKYKLKPEYIEMFDTHYFHFKPTRIDEAEAEFTKHFQTLSNSDKVFLAEPPVEPIEDGAYKNLGAFTRTVAFAVMCKDVLELISDKRKDEASETILNYFLYLLHAAALDSRSSGEGAAFVDIMTRELFFDGQGSTCVLKMLCQLLNSNTGSPETNARVMRIMSILKEQNESLQAYFDEHLEEKVHLPTSETAEERRKRIGKEKQMLAMENMRSMQQKFAENNEDELEADDEVDAGDDGFKYAEEECILCRMHQPDTAYGVIGYTMQSNVWRDVPFHDKQWVYEAYGGNADLEFPLSVGEMDNLGGEEWQQRRKEFNEEHTVGPGFRADLTQQRPVFVSCGHGLHYSCYVEYRESIKHRRTQLTRNFPEDPTKGEFLCPLCHGICNVFLPTMWNKNKRKMDDVLDSGGVDFVDYLNQVGDLSSRDFYSDMLQFGLLNDDAIHQGLEHMTDVYASVAHEANPSFGHVGTSDASVEPTSKTLDSALANAIKVYAYVMNPQSGGMQGMTLRGVSSLVDTFANTISSLEIALRGYPAEDLDFGLVVGQLKGRTLKNIQLFGELCKTTIGLLTLMDRDDSRSFRFTELTRTVRLDMSPDWSPLKLTDANFENFARNALIAAPGAQIKMVHLLKTYYMGTVVNLLKRLVIELSCGNSDWAVDPAVFQMPGMEDEVDDVTMQALATTVAMVRTVVEGESGRTGEHSHMWENPAFIKVVYVMAVKTVTPFLRKCALFLHALCGVGFKASDWEDAFDLNEMEKLCQFMHQPALKQLLVEMATEGSGEYKLVAHWLEEVKKNSLAPSQGSFVEYPGIVRLLRLPERLDEFFDIKNHSMLNAKELPADPAVCLFCGVSVGLQNLPLGGETRGECYLHMRNCAGGIGIYLLPKRCSMLLLRNEQGSFRESPYLDSHGETDETLRRGKPQFLQQNRYDYFTRNTWLLHEVPNFVARKLEQNTDFGGWETL